MTIRDPIAYALSPVTVDAGVRWLTLSLQNTGEEDLKGLGVRLNSLDTGDLEVRAGDSYVDVLRPDEEKAVTFQVDASRTTGVYVVIDGWKGDERFRWESFPTPITVDPDPVKIESLLVQTRPYAVIGEVVGCEATVRALRDTNPALTLEFWVETPDGEFRSLSREGFGVLLAGDEARRSVEFEPTEEGIYIVHAYLHAYAERLDHAQEHVSVTR
jgi:hypothetical protein